MSVTFATVSSAGSGPGPRLTYAFFPETTNNTVTVAADSYIHVGPYTATTDAQGGFTVDLPSNTDQGGGTLVWRVVETPVTQIPNRGLAARTIGYFTIPASIDYDDLVASAIAPTTVTPTIVENVGNYAADAQASADAAATSAASVNREQANGVAGLDGSGKLYSTRIPDLTATYVSRSARTQHAPALGLYFPEAAGAVGDGVTNDAAALASAINAASGGTVVLKPGTTYAIGSAITPTADKVTIVGGTGSTIKSTVAATRMFDLNNRSYLTFQGVTFDLGGVITSAGIRIGTASTGHIFNRCTFQSTGAALGSSIHAVDLTDGATDITVEKCRFVNLLDNIRANGGVTRALIADNQFTGWGNRGIYLIGTGTAASTDITIRGNRLYSHNTAGDPRQPIAVQWVSVYHVGLSVLNNTIIGNGSAHHDGTGASLGGTADCISLHGCRGFKVAGNTVRNSGEVGITIANGSNFGVVAENVLDTCNTTGVALEGSSAVVNDVQVSGNVIRNCGQELGQTPARTGVKNAVWVNATANVNVDSNTCVDDQGTPTMLGVVYATNNTGQVTVANNPRRGVTNLIDAASGSNVNLRVDAPARRATKSADTTRNNTAVLAADPHLTLPSVQAGTYAVRAFLVYQATTTADVSVSWTRPGGTTMTWTANSPIATTTTVNTSISRLSLNHASTFTLGAVTGSDVIALFEGVVTITTAGAVTLNWSQAVAEVSDATLRAGSWLELKQVA